MSSNINQSQIQSQRLTPQQILQANIMQLNNTLLEQRIIKELEDNPTLEIADNSSEEDEHTPDEEIDDSDFDWDELDSDTDRFELKKENPNSLDFLFTNHTAPKTLADKMYDQLADINISDEQVLIAYEIIGNLDDDGYFKVEPILIADRLKKTEKDVLSVLKIIQGLEPLGIASRNLKECMLIQINKDQDSLAYAVVDRCFDDFSQKRYEKISEKLNCSLDELQEAVEQIKKLNPRPGDSFLDIEKEFIIPDLVVEKRVEEWVIHLNDNSMYELRVNDEYKNILKAKKKDKKTLKFIREKLDAASWFIDAIKQRKKTILSIMKVIIDRQSELFNSEKQQLKPMILKDIANDLNLDISTISRATNGRYVQLPWGIFELKSFFSESITMSSGEEVSNTIVKERIRQIISKEDKSHPYDDQSITDILTNEGYIIARRTVTKYRSMIGILKSKLRREIN